jgi:hypothetical protein
VNETDLGMVCPWPGIRGSTTVWLPMILDCWSFVDVFLFRARFPLTKLLTKIGFFVTRKGPRTHVIDFFKLRKRADWQQELFPALFANRLFADRTSHSRGSAPLLPILCTQFSSELLSVAHSTVFPRFHPRTHPHVGTLIRRHTCSTFVLHSYFCFLLLWMRNTCGDSLQTKNICCNRMGRKSFVA